jgi:hypothetical protein
MIFVRSDGRDFVFAAATFLHYKHKVIYYKNVWILWSLISFFDVWGNVIYLDLSLSDGPNFKWKNVGTGRRWFLWHAMVVISFLQQRHFCTTNTKWYIIRMCELYVHSHNFGMCEVMLYIRFGDFRIWHIWSEWMLEEGGDDFCDMRWSWFRFCSSRISAQETQSDIL